VGLYQDLVDGHVVVLGERVDNRRGNVFGIEDTSATPGFLSRPPKAYSSML
jgi:hypothetical protein